MGLLVKLQNGETALKSLKFGKDRLGGGDSGQPYIQNPIIDEPGKLSQADNDFLLRGGLRAPINAIEDVARLTKYMFNLKNPSGLLFIAKQNLLSRVAVPNEAAQKWGANSPGAGYAGGALNEGVYTPLSTLAQAGVGFLGIHLNKQGIDPTGLLPSLSIKKYEEVASKKNQPEFNKLNINIPIGAISLGNVLSSTPLIPGLNPFAQTTNFSSVGDVSQLSNIGTFSNRLLSLWYNKEFQSTNDANILEYGGGPSSILGVGKTKIPFADQRTGINNSLFTTDKQYFLKGGKLSPSTYIVRDKNGYYKITDTLNYNNLLGASVAAGLDSTEIGIRDDGTLDRKLGPHTPNYTLRPGSNYIGNDPTGSKAYQANRSDAVLKNESAITATYVSPINERLKASGLGTTQNVSGSGRQLIADPKYDIKTGTFEPQSNATGELGKYSSKNTLWNDNLSEDYKVSPKNHKEGYLANLDKNAGYYYTTDEAGNTKLTFALAQYPRNLAPDFRKTSRKVRGFTDYSTSEDDGYVRGSYDILTTDGSDYISDTAAIIDKIYYSSKDKRTSTPIDSGKDLIKFKIDIINPTNPSSRSTLNFRAYIDNLSDTYNSEWKSQTYMGRAEKFYKYDAFGRSISLGFTIVAENPSHLNTMYNQLNELAASLAPTYTTFGYMAGNLHGLTIGNYLHNQVGIMDGLTYEITEDSPWNIDRELPLYIKVSGIKFTPIHNFRPESQFNGIHKYIDQSSNQYTVSTSTQTQEEDIYLPQKELPEVKLTPNNV